jgi:hypothetical protein
MLLCHNDIIAHLAQRERVFAETRFWSAFMDLQSIVGLIDFWSKDHRKFYHWGFAMNGQTSRLETTRQIIFSLGIRKIIETGTFRGTTTEWFGQFGIPVATVEVNERYFVFSKARLKALKNVTVSLNSSVEFLKMLVQTDIKNEPYLFYLDAHWEKYLPLREELELIFNNFSRAVVLVDDFKVDDDLGYGFDSFGPETTLDLAHVSKSHLPNLFAFSPSTKAIEETGKRRGWVVLTSDESHAERLGKICLLRPVRK